MLAFLCFGCGGRSSILISTHHEHLLLLEDHDVGIIKELHKNFSISPPPRQWRRRQFDGVATPKAEGLSFYHLGRGFPD